MVLEERADARQIHPLHVVDEHDAVGVADGDGGDVPHVAADLNGLVYKSRAGGVNGYLGGLKDGRTHADAHALNHAVLQVKPERLDARAGFNVDYGLVGHAALVDVLGDAADSVAAHLRLRAVGVVHIHLEVGLVGWADADKPVAARAEVPVGHLAGKLGPGRLGQVLLKAVDVHIVVAAALHFSKLHT